MESAAVRRDKDRQAESGQVMQCLIDAYQRPEPGMLQVNVESGSAKPLGAIYRDVNREIDKSEKPESRRENQDQYQRNRQVHEAMRQQRQCPAGLLILAERHPGSLQYEIGDDVLEGKNEHPSDKRAYRNRG